MAGNFYVGLVDTWRYTRHIMAWPMAIEAGMRDIVCCQCYSLRFFSLEVHPVPWLAGVLNCLFLGRELEMRFELI